MAKVYAQGTQTVVLADTYKIAVLSDSPVTLYKQVGYPNHPATWDLLYTTAAGENYISAAMTAITSIRIDASASDVQYDTGTAPVVGALTDDLSATDATWTVTGLAAAQGGYVRMVGGTSSTAGNAGGAAGLLGGTPGATGVGGAATATGGAGGSTSGKGGAVNLTGGAGTAGNASGGSVILQPGAKNGSGLDGGVFNRGTTQFRKQSAATAKADGAESITAAQMINGIVVFTVTTGRTMTTPTGAAILAGCPTDIAAGDSFDFTLITIGAGADDIATLTAGDGDVTFVGSVTVGPSGSTFNDFGTWRFRYTGANAFVGYRVG